MYNVIISIKLVRRKYDNTSHIQIVRYIKILKTLIWENCLRIAEIQNLILNPLLCCAPI